MKKSFQIITLCLAFLLPRAAIAAGDIVALKNGDFHHGAVARETFSIDTPYGLVTIPYGQMATLRFGEVDRIMTQVGDQFTGKLRETELYVMRDLEPSLPVDVNDIAQIEFGKRPNKGRTAQASDAIELANGDHFRATVLGSQLLIKSPNSLSATNTAEIHILDFNSEDGDAESPLHIQVTFNTPGKRFIGELLTKKIAFKTAYGQEIEIPGHLLETVAFAVYPKGLPIRNRGAYGFRQSLPPHALLRDTLANGSEGPLLTILRGGKFTRGNDGMDTDEAPPVEITLPKPFAIGVHEVTFDEYDRFCASAECELPEDGDWGRGRRPVINVSWEEAKAYTAWLSAQTGQRYRLPTDAEWEYAARAGTTTKFWWGDEIGRGHANCADCNSLWDGEKTARTGKFPPNPFGLHDTAGNVFEWVEDCWHDSYKDAPKDGSPLQKEGCGKRVIRGGGWSFPAKESRSANRWRDFPTRRSEDTGFRVVRELD